jgi:upstream-binding transcription factor
VQSIPLVKSLLEKEHEGDDNGKKKKKGKGKANKDRKKPCPAYVLWCKDQWNEVRSNSNSSPNQTAASFSVLPARCLTN